MKKTIIFVSIIFSFVLAGCAGTPAPEGTSSDGGNFSGSYDNAWRYLKYIKKDLERAAGDRSWVYAFIDEGALGGGNTDISISFARSFEEDILRIVGNSKGLSLYFVFTNADLEKEPFSANPDASFLDRSFSTKMNDYGLTSDGFSILNRAFPEVEWKSK
jgi:hypothetical protein